MIVAAAKKRGLRLIDGRPQRRRNSARRQRDRRLRADAARSCMPGSNYTVRLPLVGAFQVENALVAAGLAIATGGEPAAVFAALESLEGAKGRLELAGSKQRRADFRRLCAQARRARQGARSAAALREAASSSWCSAPAATATRGKRPMMGAIAAEKADRVIVTDDNPRSEESGRDPRGHPGRCAGRDRDRRPRARRSARRLRHCGPATCC